ncbi:lipid A deacylase LpxR family protein [Undibacterium sp. TJN25]|uniref:lipid A deacylase LpxR family protein n=1 Tax=Undibacterium sp. TJN25 TaxID=3413056 RepID=UPI003BF26E5F
MRTTKPLLIAAPALFLFTLLAPTVTAQTLQENPPVPASQPSAAVQPAMADIESQCSGIRKGVNEFISYPSVSNLYFENDLFTGTDRDYTNGVKLSWVSSNLRSYTEAACLPEWIKGLNSLFTAVHPGDFTSRNMVVTLGQSMYTPQDRLRRDVIPNDRPYAGWLYLGLGYNARKSVPPQGALPNRLTEKLDVELDRMDTVEVNIGVVGPAALGKQTQDFIHNLRGIGLFYGWDNQLHNELGLQLVAERKYKVSKAGSGGVLHFDAISHYGASLGNVQTYANAGMEFRLGTGLPDDFGSAPIRPGGDSNSPIEGEGSRYATSGVHAFLALDGRLVARNIFLDGNTFSSSPSVHKKYLTGDAALGFAWQWRGGKVAYAHYINSKEFTTQVNSHKYGSVTLSLEM